MIFWIGVGIVLLGLMVLVHEWGHFVIARLVGVRVEIFSIGFGPRLAGVKRGDTDYRVSAVPLGGYVKMAGDQPGEEDRTGAPDEFFSKPRWQRTLIVLGGPTVNILTAILVLWGLFFINYERPAFLDEPPIIASVLPNSAAEQAGLQAGDRIVKFGHGNTGTWHDLLIETALASTAEVSTVFERDGAQVTTRLSLPSRAKDDPWLVGWRANIPAIVVGVQAESPGDRAGLKPGDLLLRIQGEPVHMSLGEIAESPVSRHIQEANGQPVTLEVERTGKVITIQATPVETDQGEGKRWVLGIIHLPAPRMIEKDLTLLQALPVALEETQSLARRMIDLVARLFTGRAGLGGVAGPVGITYFIGMQGEQGGWLPVINLTAAISLSLGILNLLPIPILDGGHILFFAIEGVIRRDLSVTVKERLSQAALAFFLLVFALVMYNDIARILSN